MDTKELFLTFIQESDKELEAELKSPTDTQGNDFHREHYFELKKEFKKAEKLLNKGELELFYFHYCRTGQLPLQGLEKNYLIWEIAYKKQAIYMEKTKYHYKFSHCDRLLGLIVYGFDYKFNIDTNNNFEDYKLFREMYQKIGSYWSIPGMIKKAETFANYSKNESFVNRISKALSAIEFFQDFLWDKDVIKKRDDLHNYSPVNLNFWGAIFLLLFSENPLAEKTINEFKNADYLPRFDEQIEILGRLEKAKIDFNKKK
jgi:hypothetical protein